MVVTRVLSMEFQLDMSIIAVDPRCALLRQLYSNFNDYTYLADFGDPLLIPFVKQRSVFFNLLLDYTVKSLLDMFIV